MKLNKIHIFLMLLFVLILGCTCLSKSSLFEGYTSSTVTGPAGNSATVATGTNGNTAVVTDTNNTSSTNDEVVVVDDNNNNDNYNDSDSGEKKIIIINPNTNSNSNTRNINIYSNGDVDEGMLNYSSFKPTPSKNRRGNLKKNGSQPVEPGTTSTNKFLNNMFKKIL